MKEGMAVKKSHRAEHDDHASDAKELDGKILEWFKLDCNTIRYSI